MKAGWEEKRLDEICFIARGGSPRPIKDFITDDDDGVNWIKIGDTEFGGRYIRETKQKIIREGMAKSRFVKKGSFLLSNSMSFGRPYILEIDGCIHDGWLVLEPDYSQVDQEFLYHALSSRYVFDQFDRLAAGSTVRNLNIGLASQVTLPLPPLEEQKRIVAVLDAAFEGLDRARAHVEANLQNARDLFQSSLAKAFSNEKWDSEQLVAETFEKVKVPKKVKKKEYMLDGIFPIVSQEKELINGHWDIESDTIKVTRPIVVFGDHTRSLKLIDFDFVVGADGTSLMLPKPAFHPAFYFFALRTIDLEGKGYARHFSHLKKESFRFPSDLDEQKRISTELTSLEAKVEDLTAEYQSKLADLDDLRQSLLQKAFAGELT